MYYIFNTLLWKMWRFIMLKKVAAINRREEKINEKVTF